MTAEELTAIKRRAHTLALTAGMTPDQREDAVDLTLALYRAAGPYGITPAEADASASFTDNAIDLIRARARAPQ